MQILVQNHHHAAQKRLGGEAYGGDRPRVGKFISLPVINAIPVDPIHLLDFETLFLGAKPDRQAYVDRSVDGEGSHVLHPEPEHGQRLAILRCSTQCRSGFDPE